MDNERKIRLDWVPEAYKEQLVPAIIAARGSASVFGKSFVKKPVKKGIRARKP